MIDNNDWMRYHPAKEESLREIPKELLRRTDGHGYGFGCECDLEGGDPDCKIQPPYETIGQYIDRLLNIILDLIPEPEEIDETVHCKICGRDMGLPYEGNCNDCVPF